MSQCKLNILCLAVRQDPSAKRESCSDLEISSQLRHSCVLVTGAHRMIGLQLFSSLQHCSTAGDRTMLSGTSGCGGPQCTSLPGHRHQSAPDFSLRKILTREFDSVPHSPKALQNCNNYFFWKILVCCVLNRRLLS